MPFLLCLWLVPSLVPPQRTAVAAPPLALELKIEGRVRPPRADVALHAGVRWGGEWVFETSFVTAADGSFLVALPTQTALGIEKGWVPVVVEVDEAGYQRRMRRGRLPPVPKVWKDFDVNLVPGTSALIRMVDEQGEPTEATITACAGRVVDEGTWNERLHDVGPAERIDHGLYALHLERSLTADLFAVSVVGTGLLANVELDVERRDQELTFVLEAGATLAGTLRDPDGYLFEGTELAAYPIETVAHPHPKGALSADRRRWTRSGGNASRTTRTTEGGLFVFTGLYPGDYFIQHTGSLPIERTRWSTGNESVELTIDAYRLLPEVFDARGTPQAVGDVELTCLTYAREYGSWIALAPDARALGRGALEFSVRPDRTYVLSVVDRLRGLIEHTVEIEPGSHTTRPTLRLGDERAPAILHVRVPSVPATAAANDPLASRETTFFDVLSAAKGIVLRTTEENRTDERMRADTLRARDAANFTLPPGEYVVRARPGHERWLYSGNERVTRGPVEQHVALLAGEERTIELVPWIGGHVRLALTTTDGSAFERSDTCHGPRLDHAGERFWIDVHELDEDDRPLRSIDFELEPGPGCSFRSLAPLRRGTRFLRVAAAGFEMQTLEVLAEENRTVDVALVLRPVPGARPTRSYRLDPLRVR